MVDRLVSVDDADYLLPEPVRAALVGSLSKSDLGLGNVDDTSDADKPVSTATQAALGGKANTSHQHVAADVTDLGTAVDALVPAATTTTRGRIELATAAEALAGSDTVRALSPSTLKAVLDALVTSDRGVIAGDNGRSYRVVATPLRNSGSGWAVIQDSGHEPMGITGVSQTATEIQVSHNIGATKVIGSAVTIDDSLAGLVSVGASVGLANSYLTLRKRDHFSDYLSHNGTAWSSLSGLMSVTGFSGGVATVSHANVFTADMGGNSRVVNITGRAGAGGLYRYGIGAAGYGPTSVSVEVRNNAGTLLASPDASVRFMVDRGTYVRTLDPSEVDTTSYPGSNIWFMAILEV